MYVCLCRGITQKQIRREVLEGGAISYEDIQERLDVGVCCGTCRDSAEQTILEAHGHNLARESQVIQMWAPVRKAG